MTPIEALEWKLGAIRTLQLARSVGPRYFQEPECLHGDAGDLADDIRLLTLATPVAWEPGCFDVTRTASQTLPLDDWPPAPTGESLPRLAGAIHCFPRPLLTIAMGEKEHGNTVAVEAIHVAVGIRPTGQVLLMLMALGRSEGLFGPCCRFQIEIGKPIEAEIDGSEGYGADPTWGQEIRGLLRWVFTAFRFLDQRLIQSAPALVERHARKRALKLGIDPAVHVVTMRRVEHPAAAGGAAGLVEWMYRWLVRGHWRRQYHPQTGTHVPTWIDPYIKGPADRPFKAPAPEVWRVSR